MYDLVCYHTCFILCTCVDLRCTHIPTCRRHVIPVSLQSHTYGLIGYGHTGPAFAKLLRALGCKVYAYDRYNPVAGDENAEMTDLETIKRECDVISLHVNYMPENKYFINKQFIDGVEHPFVLINTSRGLVVNTEDVVCALEAGQIRVACLDVLEYESTRLKNLPKEQWPAAMERLAQMENAILTPHVGGQTPEAELRHELSDKEKQEQLIEKWIKESNLN